MHRRITALALVVATCLLGAQNLAAQTAQITGRVTDRAGIEPLASALVLVEGTAIRTVTDSAGRYRLINVPAGPAVLRIQRLGYALRRIDIIVPTEGALSQDVVMARSALEVEGVRVVADPAGRARGETGSATIISGDAIRSQVAASVAGVLELVPGTPLAPPGLDNIQQFSLRATPVTAGSDITGADASAQNLSAFGTAFILDGVPVSNNANLQSLGARGQIAVGGTAGVGIDLRRLPATTIERVEVIRGVPSARWGDLTHGAVIIDTRAGAVAPELLARVDANTSELSLLAGYDLGAKHTVTLTSNAARTRVGGGVRNDEALRLSGQLAHRWTSTGRSAPGIAVGENEARLTLDTRLDVYRLSDDRPEIATLPGAARSSLDQGVRLLERLNLRFANDDRLHVTAAIERGTQVNWSQRNRSSGVRAMTTRLTPGTEVGRFIGGIYNARVDLDGAPQFSFLRAEYLADRSALGGRHEIRLGTEIRHEGNAGQGFSFDLLFPAQSDLPGPRGFDRPRRFADIPALAMSAAYLDDRLTYTFANGSWAALQAGVRVDALHDRGQWGAVRSAVFQPRLNAEYSPIRWLSLRAGAGRMTKAPSLGSLHPASDFYDVVNVNYFANEADERLAVLSTFVFDPTNPELRHSVMDRVDLSVDLHLARTYVSLTAYVDELSGGFGVQPEPTSILRELYQLTNVNPGSGTPPGYEPTPTRTDTVPVLVSRASNNIAQRSRGLELTADFPEIPYLRTRVALQAAYARSEIFQDRIELGANFSEFQLLPTGDRIPYFGSFTRTGALALLTSRFTHHQPELGLIITAVVQHNLHQVRQNLGAVDSLAFLGYLGRDGVLVPVPVEQRSDPQYADLRATRTVNLQQARAEPDWLMSLQVAKSLPLGGRFSIYAFNALDRPGRPTGAANTIQNLYPSTRFGVELTMPLAALTEWR